MYKMLHFCSSQSISLEPRRAAVPQPWKSLHHSTLVAELHSQTPAVI